MGDKSIEEITAKLEEAQAGVSKEVASPTTEKETVLADTSDETEKGTTKKGTGAQARIQELVAKAKAFETELEATKSKYADKEAEVGKLIDLVKDRETDSRIVAKINELHKQPEYKDVVEKLDRAIRGLDPVEEKPAKGAETPAPGVDLLKGIKGQVEQLAERQAFENQDLRSDLLLQKSELVLEKLFAQLPETEYTEDDRRVLNSALADFIDWDAIEAKPAALEQLVAAGFQKVTDWYGDPKGRIAAEAAKTTQKGTDAKSESDVDYTKLDYGKLKTVSVGGKERQAPAISDDEFSAMMGAALRKERAGR
jgi:hypothetical protein